jgi:hypothetical protein
VQGHAFIGDSHGYVSSRFALGALAGQRIYLRFRIGSDSRFANFGWFIDDVRVYDCAAGNVAPTAPPPPPVITSVRPAEDGLAVAWTAQTEPTGISAFLLTARSAAHVITAEVPAGARGHTIRGLSSDAAYVVTVRARSAFGDALSEPSPAVRPIEERPPPPPAAVRVAPGFGAAALSWQHDPNSFDHGSRVVVKAGAVPAHNGDGRGVDVQRGSAVRIAGLVAGTAYGFAVYRRDSGRLAGPGRRVGAGRGQPARVRGRADPAQRGRRTAGRVSGALEDTRGRGLGGQLVELFQRRSAAQQWTLYYAERTDRDGGFEYDVTLPASRELQLRFSGGGGATGSTSPVLAVVVGAVVK